MLEVKKVDRPDARFSMTNNEMGAIEPSPANTCSRSSSVTAATHG